MMHTFVPLTIPEVVEVLHVRDPEMLQRTSVNTKQAG